MEGYFKVHRKILDSKIFANPTALKIWIWCLAKVTFKEKYIPVKVNKGETTVKLLPGQFVFGRFKAEEELNIDGSTIYRWMQKFASSEFEMITIESNIQYSIVTLCNWVNYQNENNTDITTNEQPTNNQRATNEQPTNTNKNDNNDNNDKNVKNKKNKTKINFQFEDFWNLYDKKVGDKNKITKKWNSLTDQERAAAMNYIPVYITSRPDKQFRKDPATFLNNKSWNDEIIQSNPKIKSTHGITESKRDYSKPETFK